MPKQEIGQVGIPALHQVSQLLDVLDQILPAVARGEKAQIRCTGHRGPVADMVVPAHDKAQPAQIFGKGGIAREVFAHAVGQLDNAADLNLFGHHNVIGDVGYTVCAFINILRTFDIHKHTSIQRAIFYCQYHTTKAPECAELLSKVNKAFINFLRLCCGAPDGIIGETT